MAEILFPSQSRGDRADADADTSTGRLSLLLACNVAVWTLASWLYRANLDWAGDMLENYSWGIEWQAGYYKHPPLFAWMTAAWFSVFPHTDAAYFALSMTNALLGVCGIIALARRFLPARDAAVAGLAMAVSPIYTTLAIKFNANTVLLSLWPWTAYFFVRYVQTGARGTALAMGVAAGIAMLGKYFSVVLLAGLIMAGIVTPAWRERLLRPRTLLAVMAGAIVLWPHVRWLLDTGMLPFRYAEGRMQQISRPMPAVIGNMVGYALMQIAYLLPSMAFVLLLTRPARGRAAGLMFRAFVRPPLCRELWWLSMGTFLAICALAIVTGTQLSVLWGNTQWFAITVLWLVVLANAGNGLETRRIPAVMAAYWIVVLVLSAGGGYRNALRHEILTIEPRHELAHVAHQVWSSHTSRRLAIVSGNDKEAKSVAFYAGTRIHFWDIRFPDTTPWLSAADARREGVLFVCRPDDRHCLETAASFSGTPPIPVSIRRTVWGVKFPVRDYLLYVSLPRENPR